MNNEQFNHNNYGLQTFISMKWKMKQRKSDNFTTATTATTTTTTAKEGEWSENGTELFFFCIFFPRKKTFSFFCCFENVKLWNENKEMKEVERSKKKLDRLNKKMKWKKRAILFYLSKMWTVFFPRILSSWRREVKC